MSRADPPRRTFFHRVLLFAVALTLLNRCEAQNFLSLISPFLESGTGPIGGGHGAGGNPFGGLVGGRGGGGIQSLLGSFAGTGNHGNMPGANNAIGEFVNLGMAFAQGLTKNGGIFSPQMDSASVSRVSRPNIGKKKTLLRENALAPIIAAPLKALSQPGRLESPTERFVQGNPEGALARIAGNLGSNFFHMLEEVGEYTLDVGQKDADNAADVGNAQQLMKAFYHAMARDPAPIRPLNRVNDGTETGRNRPLVNRLFESDIVLTSRQMKAIVLAEAERRDKRRRKHRRNKRKVITGSVYRWPKNKAIPYQFKESDPEWRRLIRSALDLWESETCVRFQEGAPGHDRLEFFKGSGCYSSVGRTGGKQVISIGYGCEDRGIVSHEVGHSLGFWHEQSRADRDKYIKLNKEYIASGTIGNFVKRTELEIDYIGLPYDLGSVMHYGPNAFTTDWDHVTIETTDKKYAHTIGQRRGPSFIDVKQVNRMYCHDKCPGSSLKCANDGYPDPNNCDRCKCPNGYGGTTCNEVEMSTCGGELTAIPIWQHLTHKGQDRCVWRIKADKARIRFILDSANYKCDATCRSYVEIKHNSDFQQIGFRSCCNEKEVEVLSEQDELIVIADAKELNRDGSFSLRYIVDSGAPLPKPPPPTWVPGSENRAFRGVSGSSGIIEKFILNAIPQIRDHGRPLESITSIFTDYLASAVLGTTRDGRK
ncbi:hypothetical protein QR680_008680 [Steinernema hermaphroditum]|uniref:Metalloendopeptidase n=1 Tax=Steinernema hermaphroditum TaxID=289476 RepID=A0AA39M7G4_9BILA|nr:hypothetical protein QR680_008680 [Steinernema hermaphroditum]